jgi:acetyltransferase-like isoleucine patch superfamily enzyme
VDSNVIIYGPIDIDSETYLGPNSILGFPESQNLRNALLEKNLDPKLEKRKPTKIGKSVIIRSNCVIYSGVTIEDNVRFGHNVMVRENVKIREDSTIGTNSVIDGSCEIGHNVSIQTGVYISTYTTVEDNVFLGPVVPS